MSYLKVIGARTNNLKNINVKIPLNKFTCVTGISGGGKSSLVYDTIYAESQRNFLELFSNNIFGQKIMDKPDVDGFENLKPAINISQKYFNKNPRSTVGTFSEISLYLRNLFALIISEEEQKTYSSNYFSFNDPNSVCYNCHGLGVENAISFAKIVPDQNVKLIDGAITYLKGPEFSYERAVLIALCDKYNIDKKKTFNQLTDTEKENLFYRKNQIKLEIKHKVRNRFRSTIYSEKGIVVELQERLIDAANSVAVMKSLSPFVEEVQCHICLGKKLKPEVLQKKICMLNISDVEKLELRELLIFFSKIKTNYKNAYFYNQIINILSSIESHIFNMSLLKLDYLSLERIVPTLSTGEIQRLRLANQLDSSLNGLIYLLDEPCKGLHSKDIDSIINVVRMIINKNNTVIAIEHNKKFISHSDYIIELGPKGGKSGGYLLSENFEHFNNINLNFKKVNLNNKKFIKIYNGSYGIIKKQNVTFPANAITCITGVSGSGKTTLAKLIEGALGSNHYNFCEEIENECINKIYYVSNDPIGKTPRSTVVSYLGIYDDIRELMSKQDTAKLYNIDASMFSVNIAGGRCECCQGTGLKKFEMNYMPDTYIKCPECNGERFLTRVLQVKYEGYNISDILNCAIEDIVHIFEPNKIIYDKLKCMIDIGLGYLSLGQRSMNLSGGESKRVKLAKYLTLNKRCNDMFILDEPCSGLNEVDIDRLKLIFVNLIKKGYTLILIEHNLEFISSMSDYIIDLGNNSGKLGGIITCSGEPQFVFNDEKSSLK